VSEEKDDGGPAFPVDRANWGMDRLPGMSLRDFFAGQALVGLLANPEDGSIVKQAYLFADAMLAERNK
jgi:hypothetical protein